MIRAARVWTVSDGHTLQSINRIDWTPGKPSRAMHLLVNALNLREEPVHYGPWAGCRCGLWGVKLGKGEKTIFNYLSLYQRARVPVVIGTVKLWGKIIEHKTGYRGEFGYPELLFTFGPKADKLAVNLSELYGVAAEPFTWEKWRNK